MQKLSLIPTIISSLRIAVLPLFFYLFNTGNITSCLILFASSAITDLFDGYLARKLKVTSRFGAYYGRSNRLCPCNRHIHILRCQRILSYMALAAHNRIIHSILSLKPLRQKTIRPNRQIHWKRPIHRHSFNLGFSIASNVQLCRICLRRIFLNFACKPHSKLCWKKRLGL